MSCAQFKLDMFEGPLDLLLHLISKHKLNIHDIQISLLLEQYLEYMHQLEHEDLEDAAEFLEMAARLIYIKTVSLLPHDEEAQELKKELEGRLIEYSQCKLLAGILAKGYVGGDVFVRKPEPIPVDKTYTREHDAVILLEAYLGLSEKARNEKPINAKIFQPLVSHKVVSLGTKIVYILKKLYTCGVCDLSHIYDGMETKSERVATFLAILELTKSGRIVLNDDNTQISFSDRTINRKKNRKDKSDAQQENTEDTAAEQENAEEAVSSAEGADEVGEKTAEAEEKPEDTQQESAQSVEQRTENDDEGGQEPADTIDKTQQTGVPEFDPLGSAEPSPLESAETAVKYGAGSRQATERVAEFKPLVLELPIAAAEVEDKPESGEQTAAETESAEKAAETGLPIEAAEAEDKPESGEQTAAEAENAEKAVENELPIVAAEVEEKPESGEQTAVEAESVEKAAENELPIAAAEVEEKPESGEQTAVEAESVEKTAETELPIVAAEAEEKPESGEETAFEAESAEKTAETGLPIVAAEVEFAETAYDEGGGVPFKPSYWGKLRYYWGFSPVGDDSQRNCWRYGRALF